MSGEDAGLGAIVGAAITALGVAFAAHQKRQEKVDGTEATAEHEERENTRDFAIREGDRAARYEKRIEELSEEARRLSVEAATSVFQRDEALAKLAQKSAEYEAEKLGRIAAEEMARSLTTTMAMAQQLIDRQRDEVAKAQADRAAEQSAHAETRRQYDAFVERVMKGSDA